MKKTEIQILKKTANHNKGLLSPADMINGVANRDERSVNRLISKGYIDEVTTEINQRRYTFYRITEKGIARSSLIKWILYNTKRYVLYFMSALLGASLAFVGDIGFNHIRNIEDGNRLANEVKWEIFENISDSYSDIVSYNQEVSFNQLKKLKPDSSVLDSKFLYLTTHPIRDQLYRARSTDFGILDYKVMKDVLEFYSLLYAVDEKENQLEKIFFNRIPVQSKITSDIATDISENTKKMRTAGAQAVGEIMFYYKKYDLVIKKIDSPQLTPDEIVANLLTKVNEFVENKKTGEIISAPEVMDILKLNDPNIYECNPTLDVCALATAHYLILKTGMVDKNFQIFNGQKRK